MDRIVGTVTNLGHEVSDQTVGNILKRYGIPTAPERKKTMTWTEFTGCPGTSSPRRISSPRGVDGDRTRDVLRPVRHACRHGSGPHRRPDAVSG